MASFFSRKKEHTGEGSALPRKRKKNWKRVLKKNLFGYLFLLIPLVLFAFYVWVPMGENVVLSFFNDYTFSENVGFANYAYVFQDPAFLSALRNTFIYIGYSLLIGYLVPVILGFLLSECVHARGLFRVLLYLPCMISGIAVVFLFSNLYGDETFSILNILSVSMGGTSHPWKGDPNRIIPLIVLAMTWRGAGSTALIYLSAFQGIDDSIYEASRLDGANPWQRFWRLTVPALRGTLVMLLALQIISVFQVFYEPMIIGPWGGPVVTNPDGTYNYSSLSLMLLSYSYAFQQGQVGHSAASSILLGLIILVFTIGYYLLKSRFEKQERGISR